MGEVILAVIPVVVLVIAAAWGSLMASLCKFQRLSKPVWPFAENPGLALELADSLHCVDAVLGEAHTEIGDNNRKKAALLQKLDFVFIPLYTLFFLASALALGARGVWFWPILVVALATAVLDVLEDRRILGMLRGSSQPAKPFGRWKWTFYFVTVAAEGIWLFIPTVSRGRAIIVLAGLASIAIGIGGTNSSIRARYAGIASAAKFSALPLLLLAITPLVLLRSPAWWEIVVEYGVLLRVPLLLALLLATLPAVAFLTGARSLLRGLFDLSPWSLFTVTLTALAVAGTVCESAFLVLAHAHERMKILGLSHPPEISPWVWPVVMTVALPVIVVSAWFSTRQGHGLIKSLTAATSGTLLGAAMVWVLSHSGPKAAFLLANVSFERRLAGTGLFSGYVNLPPGPDPWNDHLAALLAFAGGVVLYAVLGFYGRLTLGKTRTVPALCSALMLLMMLGWMLSAVAFFFDAWRVPVLLIIVLAGTVTAQSTQSDHFYDLKNREDLEPAPDPTSTLAAANTPRIIVVAANGGGIQAAAWTARVLLGLVEDCGETFKKSLRLISSVSGGSVGNACFVDWLANTKDAELPDKAAAKSSLDEVAWGLCWPDFLRSLFPWILRALIGRGRALERAWLRNASPHSTVVFKLDAPLSRWNAQVKTGELPAVVMNATLSETGERLLLATTRFQSGHLKGRARVDGAELHTINGQHLDVAVVTAARLSASFPYVTPAARSDGPGPQPHVVDGGYYDNYGMATLVEWLDEGLTGASDLVRDVLVLQIHGAPVDADPSTERYAKSRGWFYQAFAPLTTLAAVRSSGQLAHNDIELELLKQKWYSKGVLIRSVTFEFHGEEAPLSWHLTPVEQQAIQSSWEKEMVDCRRAVKQFLSSPQAPSEVSLAGADQIEVSKSK